MTMLHALSLPELWETFYLYKTSLLCPKQEARRLRDYIDRRAYEPVCRGIGRGETFPLPRRAVISKMHSDKKRIVYIYPEPENTVLKLLTWLLLRRYDDLFAPGLYSFRPGRTAKDAIRWLLSVPELRHMYAYKLDVSNYFNSVDLGRFLPLLERTLKNEPDTFRFLSSLLQEQAVLEQGKRLIEPKGIMAGTPQSAFYANLFLMDLDRFFYEKQIPYARYSDDIILFASTEAELREQAGILRSLLEEKGLTVNPAKESFFTPAEGWVFLGFQYKDGVVDIAPATMDKMKAKMRRKTRALCRWRDRGGHTGQQAAAAFIRVFNRKLLDAPEDHELSWSHWFFPVINTDFSLRVIDRYAQDCLRTIITGKRTKARYDARYRELKNLGYRSLVHEYYAHHRVERERSTALNP